MSTNKKNNNLPQRGVEYVSDLPPPPPPSPRKFLSYHPPSHVLRLFLSLNVIILDRTKCLGFSNEIF